VVAIAIEIAGGADAAAQVGAPAAVREVTVVATPVAAAGAVDDSVRSPVFVSQ
jgi:hypothetical protein